MGKERINNPFYRRAKLTPQQRAKCLLLEIEVFQSKSTNKYVILKPGRLYSTYVRPMDPRKGLHVEVDTFAQCIELYADPAKFGGKWS
jgi:hypothetical protein